MTTSSCKDLGPHTADQPTLCSDPDHAGLFATCAMRNLGNDRQVASPDLGGSSKEAWFLHVFSKKSHNRSQHTSSTSADGCGVPWRAFTVRWARQKLSRSGNGEEFLQLGPNSAHKTNQTECCRGLQSALFVVLWRRKKKETKTEK